MYVCCIIDAYRNGELDLFVSKEEKLELEKKLDEVLENHQLQNQFNQVLVQKLQEITNELVTTKEHLVNTERKLTEVEGENGELEIFIEKKLEKRDQLRSNIFQLFDLVLQYVSPRNV